jgi:uncharacterized protein YecT (DUF1311 family)
MERGEWDKELNKNYQALMKRLKKDEQAKLKASQRQWIKYRDAEFDFNGKFWSGFDGTASTVFSSSFRSISCGIGRFSWVITLRIWTKDNASQNNIK